MLYSAVSGEMATLSKTNRSTFHTLRSVIYNQLPHLSPFQPFSLLSSINHSLSDHKSALNAVEQPSRHCNNVTHAQRLHETWPQACENAAGTACWPLFPDLWAYWLDPTGVKIDLCSWGILQIKGKTCRYTISFGWLSKLYWHDVDVVDLLYLWSACTAGSVFCFFSLFLFWHILSIPFFPPVGAI